MKHLFLVTVAALVSTAAFAENYYVEPMVCKAQWNKTPTGYADSYKYAVLTVVSFKSVRASDCSLANSSGTGVKFGANEMVKASIDNPVTYIGEWFAGPLKKKDSTVSIPYGIWPNPTTLKIVKSENRAGVRVDTLTGRYDLFDDFYYDLKCEAKVVADPSHIENNTANCR